MLTLNAKESEEALARLRALQPGDTVTLTVSSSDQRWSQAVQPWARVQAGHQRAGGLRTGRLPHRLARHRHQADGTVIFYAMDGKQPGYSVGATQARWPAPH